MVVPKVVVMPPAEFEWGGSLSAFQARLANLEAIARRRYGNSNSVGFHIDTWNGVGCMRTN